MSSSTSRRSEPFRLQACVDRVPCHWQKTLTDFNLKSWSWLPELTGSRGRLSSTRHSVKRRRDIPYWLTAVALAICASLYAQTADPLPSWDDGSIKQSIVSFVRGTTDMNDRRFVPLAERIAVFDNDGALWVEQPMYAQLAFALDRVKALVPSHPDWRTEMPFSAVLKDDVKAFEASGDKGLEQVIFATHTGMTPDEFTKNVNEWIAGARHPRFNRPYTDLVYQPMIELLAYLRANGYKTYIVTGGTVEFVRAWSDRVYGIPPEQVVGTTFVTKYSVANG